MSQAGIRRYRDKLLFALAYAVVFGAVLFAHPFAGTTTAPASPAAIEAGR